MSDVLIAVAMLGALALIGTGGWLLVQGRGSRLRAGLMVAAGCVTIFNVWVNIATF